MAQVAFFFDGTRCTGCKTCVIACKDAHDLDVGETYRRVYEYTGGQTHKDDRGVCTTTCFSYYVSLACCHCSNPACVKVCPTGAMSKDAQTGLVNANPKICIGCGYCHLACPYDAPKVDRTAGHSAKCDGCAQRLAQGLAPVCVEACPSRALSYGIPSDFEARGARANIAPLPNVEQTMPNLFVAPSRDARPAGSHEGSIGNVQEVK